jgi:SWI/SNF-related matrix-associated actin-dependent regulator 1 of chromatin subfamily A
LLDYLPTENVVIINYDLLVHHRPWVDQIAEKYGWDLVICDEAHYLKNPKAKRTVAVLGGRLRRDGEIGHIDPIDGRKLFLTGTPLVNRPVELWPILKECDPTGLGENWQKFVRRYCGAYKGRYGWDTGGATNLEELQVKLRSSIMIRRRTNDVLDQLPAIQRQAIVLPDNGNADLIQAEWEAFNNHDQVLKELKEARTNEDSDMDSLLITLRDRQGATFAELAKYRKLVGMAKKDHVIEHCRNVIDSRGKLVLFAWHKDVVTVLLGGLSEFNPVRLTGGDSQTARQASVDAFQDDETVKVIVLNLEAGGVGITLTGTEEAGFCTSVVFSELDWRPSIMQQAERRVARLGADESATNILVHHIVLDGSLDATISNTLIDKQSVIDQAIN